jgi:VWFA-related protein
VYEFLLDDLFLEPNHTLKVRNLLRMFIEDKMSANDIGAIVLTSGVRAQEFTRDRQKLLDAVNHVVGSFEPSFDQPFSGPRIKRVRTMIVNLSRSLGSIKDRQKALVVISPRPPLCFVVRDNNGRLRDDGQPVSCGMMFEAAVQSGVSIYVVDPRGLVTPNCVSAEWSGSSCAGATIHGAVAAWSSSVQSGMHTLAEETGGFAAVMTNSFEAVFERIVRENSTYYLIGYYSTNDRADGKFRTHNITVNRRDVRTVNRAGYLAPRRSPR